MSVLNISKENFHKEVIESDKPVLLDFWAPWCVHCRVVAPVLDEVAKERPDVKVGKINVDEDGELAAQFGIMSIPCLIVVENGEEIDRAVGAKPKAQLLEMLP